ncbi:MAG: malto-oligosyltrehalose trehalohydrolase [Myxococcales bacterium]|nr:malto-oligosyltrehalose trehalohydrolase [Myxococcales bacterium]
MTVDLQLGATPTAGGVRFRVWAPRARSLRVRLGAQTLPLARGADDVYEAIVIGAGLDADYSYVLDDALVRPDPVSRWQPHGVHGPSRVLDPDAYPWTDAGWRGRALAELVTYELHVGTFTPEGTFAAAAARLRQLAELGVTAVELMPVAEFPGGRNWGYDGVHLFAPQSTYGGPDGLRGFVDAAHAVGLAVVLDVVYNHLGPEGNYLGDFGPYVTDTHRTPWGPALNLDGADADGVRRHLLTNAVMWFREYHVDGLRLDAIHGIFDHAPRHLLAELRAAVTAAVPDRQTHVIAESDLNDVRVIAPPAVGGYGLDAQWSDDFHHALRTALTGDRRGYFADFGEVADVAKAVTASFVYDGQRSAHRRRRHGTSAVARPGEQFVVYVQNHDQIANGSQGRRLTTIVGHRAHALAATVLLTAPNLPLLFMGEEYAEPAPFQYFVSHGDPALVAAVREGRRREHADLAGADDFVDPQAEATFAACALDWALRAQGPHAQMLALYRDLLALRRGAPCLSNCRKDLTRAWSSDAARWLVIERADPGGQRARVVCNLAARAQRVPCPELDGRLRLALATDDPRYGGDAAPTELDLTDGPLALPPHTARIYLTDRGDR